MFIILLMLTGCALFGPRPDYTVEVADMDFVFVKGGAFQMGSSDRPDEQPIHSVTIQDLFVGMHEVSFEQYDLYCNQQPGCKLPYDFKWGRADRPVVHVSWHDANAYAAWLSQQTGQKLRLPTEAEWEYFARAGTTTRYWTGETFPEGEANCKDCDDEQPIMTIPVGSYDPNPWGLYDITGNVQEWTADDYRNNYKNAPVDGSPVIYPNAPGKAIRGGSWRSGLSNMTSSSRGQFVSRRANKFIGFRLVMQPSSTLPIPSKK
jgi:formylglycine-generating enzyme required for sulfatase activity